MRLLTTTLAALVALLAFVLIWHLLFDGERQPATLEVAVLLCVCALAIALALGMAVLRQVTRFTRELEARALARGEDVAQSLPAVPGALTAIARLVDRLVFDIRHAAAQAGSLANDQAHALRTPLATIKVAMPMILRNMPAGDPNVALAVDAIEKSIDQMTVTIDRARREARAIAALLSGARPVVDLATVVQAAVEEASEEAGPRNIRISSTVDGPVMVAANFDALSVGLANVLMSAIDASPDDSEIEVAMCSSDGVASIVVQDRSCDGADPATFFESGLEYLPPTNTHRCLRLDKELRTVEAHRGTLSACRNTFGGITVTMTLSM